MKLGPIPRSIFGSGGSGTVLRKASSSLLECTGRGLNFGERSSGKVSFITHFGKGCIVNRTGFVSTRKNRRGSRFLSTVAALEIPASRGIHAVTVLSKILCVPSGEGVCEAVSARSIPILDTLLLERCLCSL